MMKAIEWVVWCLPEPMFARIWVRLPDRCEMPACTRRGVRGNENVIDGRIMCDDCHVVHMWRTKRSSVLSDRADGFGWHYGYWGHDGRQINVRRELDHNGYGWSANVGGKAIGMFPDKQQAEDAAIEYICANPEEE